MDERLAERRRVLAADRRRRRRRALIVVAPLLLAAMVVGLDVTGHIAIASVTVTGAQHVDTTEIEAAADVHAGQSLLRLSPGAVATRVEALPRVASTTVRRTWQRSLVIEVVERQPVLQASGGQGSVTTVLVDREGLVIGTDGDDRLPVVVLRTTPPSPGGSVDDHAALANAFAVWRALSGPLRADVARYVADADDRLRLELARGVTINFGRAERIDEKIRAIGAVLADVSDRAVVEVDVRAPSRPVVVVPADDNGSNGASDGGSEAAGGSR